MRAPNADEELWQRSVVARVSDSQSPTGFASALQESDLVAMSVVAFIDNPRTGRLALMAKHLGPEMVGDFVYLLIEQHAADAERPMLQRAAKQVYAELPRLVAEIPLSSSRASDIEALIDSQAVDDHQAAILLNWIAKHDLDRVVARSEAAFAAGIEPGDLSESDAFLARTLATSHIASHHSAVLALATRNAEAGHDAVVSTLIAPIHPLESDVSAIAAITSNYGPQLEGETMDDLGDLPDGAAELLDRLDLSQSLLLAAAQRVEWVTAILLPRLVARFNGDLVAQFSCENWREEERRWLVAEAEWSDSDWQGVLEALDQSEDSLLIHRAYERIHDRVVNAADQYTVGRKAMPRLGLGLLLRHALDDNPSHLDATSELLGVMTRFPEAVRHSEYLNQNWKQPARAERMARIAATVDVADAIDLLDGVDRLQPPARTAFLVELSSHVDSEQARTIVDRYINDKDALEAASASEVGAAAVLALWTDHCSLAAFYALSEMPHSLNRLDAVPAVLSRDELPPGERAKLLDHFACLESAPDVALKILDQSGWEMGPPHPEILASAVRLLRGRDLDPAIVVEVLGPLCSQHNDNTLRRECYATLGTCYPVPELVELLEQRRSAEVPALCTDVEASIDQAAIHLNEAIETHDDLDALMALARLRPQQASIHATRLVGHEARSDARLSAVRVLSAQPPTDENIELLRRLRQSDPDEKVREEARRAELLLTVGDIQAAHEILGSMTGKELSTWTQHDPQRLYGSAGDAIVTALDRVLAHESKDDPDEAINDLGGELAKIILYRAIDVAGHSIGLDPKWSQRIASNREDFGNVVRRQQLLQGWSWVSSVAALYELRTVHVAPKGDLRPVARPGNDELSAARVLFAQGIGPCLDEIVKYA